MTVYEVSEIDPLQIPAELVQNQTIRYRREDEIFQVELLEGVVLSSVGNGKIQLTHGAQIFLRKEGAKQVYRFASRLNGVRLYSATSVLMDNQLCEKWKLYGDANWTLLTALCPSQTK